MGTTVEKGRWESHPIAPVPWYNESGGIGMAGIANCVAQIQSLIDQIWEDLTVIPEGEAREAMAQALLQMEQIARGHLEQRETGDEH